MIRFLSPVFRINKPFLQALSRNNPRYEACFDLIRGDFGCLWKSYRLDLSLMLLSYMITVLRWLTFEGDFPAETKKRHRLGDLSTAKPVALSVYFALKSHMITPAITASAAMLTIAIKTFYEPSVKPWLFWRYGYNRFINLLRESLWSITSPICTSDIKIWADVNTIVRALKKQFPDFDRETLELIVAQDEKGRYSFDETGAKIRANQGHSIVISRNYALLNFSLPCLQRGHFQSSGKSSKATPSCSAGSYT